MRHTYARRPPPVQFQALAYITLIIRASAGESEEEDSGYSLASVTGAMYLLVASTTSDLRAGYALLVDGYYMGHRALGLSLLAVYGLMICAAMHVLMSEASDDAGLVLNAVTVLFIADLVRATMYDSTQTCLVCTSVSFHNIIYQIFVLHRCQPPSHSQTPFSNLQSFRRK